MEHLGREAHRHNTAVDVLCAGTCPVRVPVFQPLETSRGVLVLHDDFGVNLKRASSRAAGSHGLLEIRCSDDILITQVVGPDFQLWIVFRRILRVFKMKWLQSLLPRGPTLLRAKNYSDAIDMRATIDERVKDIASKLGSQEEPLIAFAAAFFRSIYKGLDGTVLLYVPTAVAREVYSSIAASVDRSFAWSRSDDSCPKDGGLRIKTSYCQRGQARNELLLYLKKKPFPDQRIHSDQASFNGFYRHFVPAALLDSTFYQLPLFLEGEVLMCDHGFHGSSSSSSTLGRSTGAYLSIYLKEVRTPPGMMQLKKVLAGREPSIPRNLNRGRFISSPLAVCPVENCVNKVVCPVIQMWERPRYVIVCLRGSPTSRLRKNSSPVSILARVLLFLFPDKGKTDLELDLRLRWISLRSC
ncbi:hypothetical protein ACFE04_019639 [Oxalis oulophora]